MSGHAETIRDIFWQPLRIADHDKANESLDALLAENQRLRVESDTFKQVAGFHAREAARYKEALERITVWDYRSGAHNNAVEIAREALAGDAE